MFLHPAAHLAGDGELFPHVLARRLCQGVPISLMLIGMPTSSNILLTFEIFQLLDLIYFDKKNVRAAIRLHSLLQRYVQIMVSFMYLVN